MREEGKGEGKVEEGLRSVPGPTARARGNRHAVAGRRKPGGARRGVAEARPDITERPVCHPRVTVAVRGGEAGPSAPPRARVRPR